MTKGGRSHGGGGRTHQAIVFWSDQARIAELHDGGSDVT